MAKVKKEDVIELEDFASRIRKELNAKFKFNIAKTPQEILDKKIEIIKWTPSLDLALSGGVPEGCWISLSGPEKVGKTTLSLHLAAKAQAMGKTVYYCAVEGRFKKMNLNGIKGLSQDPSKFVLIESEMGCLMSTQDYLNSIEHILKTHPGCMVIIDSISALQDEKEMEGGIGTETRGHNQKVMTQFINNVAQLVSASNSIVLGIVQFIANTSGWGAKWQEKEAKRWSYQADIQLRVKGYKLWKKGENSPPFGQILDIECRTSALGSPHRRVDSYIRYGQGADESFELVQYGLACGLISKAERGGWYTLDFLEGKVEGEVPKLQGDSEVCQYFNDNPKYIEMLNEELKPFSENLVTASE